MSLKFVCDIACLSSDDLFNLFDDETYECSICCDEIEKDEIHNTKCKHTFHKQCIDKWFEIKSTCPMCRKNLKPDFKKIYDIIHFDLNISYYVDFETYKRKFNDIIALLNDIELEDNEHDRQLLKTILIAKYSAKGADILQFITMRNLIEKNKDNFEWLTMNVCGFPV